MPHGSWESRIYSDISTWYQEVERIMDAYCERVPLSFVERKEAALVWHFRESPEAFAEFQSRKLDDELQIGFSNKAMSVSVGQRIVEAKAIECNKGNFVRWLLQRPEADPERTTLAIGDDRTDEDMFMILGREDLSVKIGSGPTAARFRLTSQSSVMKFLEETARLLEAAQATSHIN
jgi:trehalose 6-phosphate synthase/phosphatase